MLECRGRSVPGFEGAVVVNSDAPAISYLEETVGSEGHCGVEAELGEGSGGVPFRSLGEGKTISFQKLFDLCPQGLHFCGQ